MEAAPRGTAGAVRHALDRLAERFLLLNGDSFFDVNWLDLVPLAGAPGTMLAMALCRVPDTSRFGVVEIEGDRVVGFAGRGEGGPGLINAGVYLVDRRIVADFPESGSLEQLVLPRLAARGLLRGRAYDGFFIDIGVPSAFEAAQSALPRRRERPAVFFDRDGTIVVDDGYVHRPEDLVFLPGAVAAVKRVNDLGSYAFLVTNQAGVARGLFSETDVNAFNAELQRRLRAAGAHFDDMRYCPYHPEGTVEAYRRSSDWRKPAPGMLLDLMGQLAGAARRKLGRGRQGERRRGSRRGGASQHALPRRRSRHVACASSPGTARAREWRATACASSIPPVQTRPLVQLSPARTTPLSVDRRPAARSRPVDEARATLKNCRHCIFRAAAAAPASGQTFATEVRARCGRDRCGGSRASVEPRLLPDGRMLVTERPGRMRIVSRDGRLSPPLAGVPAVLAEAGRPARRRARRLRLLFSRPKAERRSPRCAAR